MGETIQDLPENISPSEHPDHTMEDSAMLNKTEDDIKLPEITIIIHHHGDAIPMSFPETATLTDLSNHITETLSIRPTNQKFLISPKVGLVKPPFNPDHLLSTLTSKKIVFMGSTPTEISALSESIATSSAPRRPGPIKAAKPTRTRNAREIQEESQYTFHTLRPLAHLADPRASLDFLERLRDDAGVRTAMKRYKFSVSLLTEMDPAMHTTHESRTLGLNRNQGEVIELRLRTDADDGYRDYKTVRKTLCHELAHNVWGEHDGNFWKLCREIEAVVERGDWTRGGRTLANEIYYEGPTSEEDLADSGGWTGGEFVVGGSVGPGGTGLGRREILARAAEERLKKARQFEGDNAGDGT